MSDWIAVGDEADFRDEEATAVVAAGVPVAIFRHEDELFALHDLCSHGAARLSDGFVENGCVECPLHQALFDLRTGEVKCAPATEGVRSYPIRVIDSRVEVNVALSVV